ncbi:MAG: radical SAM protein [Desulfonatronovibrio sp. MSAO_Bac4]|nr:MAG: radical SAM protein [Desulfonatronovibrio sp. MSAO_Bac4]
MMFEYIFGPVMSSRLGSSLGIDLLGCKVCSFDCLYCESGKTEIKTIKRAACVSLESIASELQTWFETYEQRSDFITLGGQGEPCLNSCLGEIIQSIKQMPLDIPVAVLTNSSMLSDPQVRKELCAADVVLPSLDSLVESEFKKINRPHPSIDLKGLAQGLLDFRQEFQGKIFLEVLIIPGINDSRENLNRLIDFNSQLRPDRVDITTMSRPGSYLGAELPSSNFLAEWRKAFNATVSPGKVSVTNICTDQSAIRERVLSSVKRRPQTQEQLIRALGVSSSDLDAALSELEGSGLIQSAESKTDFQKFYLVRGKHAG